MSAQTSIDKVTQRVVGGALDAIAKEMGSALYRGAYSSIIRESEDLGAGIFDSRGQTLCESDSTPMQFGSIPANLRGILERLEGELEDGDVVIHNDPYGGASHSSDICIATPIFWQGELVAFAANAAHWIDIGGAAPGINDDVIDLWAEGKIFRALKLYEGGTLNRQVDRFIFDNVRTREVNRGDLQAQLGSVHLGKRRFLELLERYGADVVFGTAAAWADYSERRLREAIAELPDGEYVAEGWLDDDAKNRDVRLKLKVAVRVSGSEITIDLTGSSPETQTACNVPFEGSTLVSAYFIVRTLLLDQVLVDEHIPQNEGIFRPITVVAPLGTIFNPRFPRACTSRFCQAQRLTDLVIKALAPVVPHLATAGNSAAMLAGAYAIYDKDTDQYEVYVEINEGSYGGRPDRDGLDGVDCLMANTRNTPIEELESHYHLRCERYELRDDDAAAGKWRGGVGIVRETRFLADGFISTQGDRHYEPPHGVFGGDEGLTGSMTKNPGTDGEESLPAKVTAVPMAAGDVLRVIVPNGGGYGDPFERDPQLVARDVADGLVAADSVEAKYGVVLDAGAVDEAATARVRAAR